MGAFQDRGSRAYFDHNATTPVDSEVLALLSTWGQVFGNPSSIHSDGRGPKALLRQARKSVAKFLNADPLEIVFTSGGSESNNMVLQGIFNWIQTGQG